MANPIVRHACAVIALILGLSGCTPDSSSTEPTQDPADDSAWDGVVADLRVTWSGEPGIDLIEGAAVPLRAYVESTLLSGFTGSIDDVYPGFQDAVLPNEPSSPLISAWDRWPNLNTRQQEPLLGSYKSHILRFEEDGQDTAALVCGYDYAVAERTPEGNAISVSQSAAQRGLPFPGIGVIRVNMKSPTERIDPASTPQEGPRPAPAADVFGEWKITGFLNSFAIALPGFADEWPTYDADMAECVEKAPDDEARREFLITGRHSRADFPTLRPSPGWPAQVDP
jgi:hypothetical protein